MQVQPDLLGDFEERSVTTVVHRDTQAGFPDGVYGALVLECRFKKKLKGKSNTQSSECKPKKAANTGVDGFKFTSFKKTPN